VRRLYLVSLFLIASCTPMQWEKADASPEEFQVDDAECRQFAWREANFRAWGYPMMMGPVLARDATGRGVFVWPMSPLYDPYGHQLMEENRLAHFCMEWKGYRLVPAPKQ
jgi:hypothetical protein